MTLSDWLGMVGVFIGVISFGYALWEKRSRARLENYVQAQNWSLYGKASNANGHTQTALTKYMALEKDVLNPEVLVFLGKADAFGQDVLKDVIRQIQYSEPLFDEATVSRWVREGRVAETHAPLFYQLVVSNKRIQLPPQSGVVNS